MKKISLLAVFLCTIGLLQAQPTPPFWQDVLAFKKQDSAQAPPAHPIVLVGSSSFTRWTDVKQAFPGYPIVNRGFGGSILLDVVRYAYETVIRYQPKQVLIYCGENDLASADSIPAAEVILRAKTLYGMLRTNLPGATIDFVSIKPSPVRAGIQGKVKEVNKTLKAFFNGQKNAHFIDLYDAMLDAKGQMREELYVGDRLHMKPEGYAIWTRIIQPYLMK